MESAARQAHRKRFLLKFEQFPLDPRVAEGVRACKYTVATPIQAGAIPPILEGRDILGLAQTGTGKTAAFALPILHRLVTTPGKGVRALVLAPTRELAEQIRCNMRELGERTRLSVVPIYGGVAMGPQVNALRRSADIVVACPGRLLDHISQRTIDLRGVEVLVLDEADMMLDMGFLPDVRRVLSHLPAQRQNLMFSATMSPEIRKLASDILRQPETVQVARSAPVETVSHALYPVSQNLKTPLLLELLKHTDTESVLIFTRTKHRAKRLGDQLVKKGFHAASIQGNLSQNKRQEAMNGFRTGKYSILVATDIAARGIDVSQVSHVINYDIPDTTAAYTHRIGRTGRALRTGDAFTLVTREDAVTVRDIERVLGAPIERRTIEGFDYNQSAPEKEFVRAPRPQPSRGRTAPKAAPPKPRAQAQRERAPHGHAPAATGNAPRQTRSAGSAGRHHEPGTGMPGRDSRDAGNSRKDRGGRDNPWSSGNRQGQPRKQGGGRRRGAGEGRNS